MIVLYLTLAGAILANTIYNSVNNHMGKTQLRGVPSRFLYLACVFAAGTAVTAALAIPDGAVSLYTIGMGTAFGVLHVLATVLMVYALSIGPLALVNFIVFCSMLLPAVSGVLFWGETVTESQWAGVAMMLVALVLCADVFGKKGSQTSRRWVTVSLLAALCSGGIGIVQKTFQSSPHTGEVSGFIAISFAVSAAGAFLAYRAYKKRDEAKAVEIVTFRPSKNFWIITAATGLLLGGLNHMNLYLVGNLTAVVFFPIHSGGVIIGSAIAGRALFKEKITRTQWLGFAFGVAAILLLGNLARLIVE